MITLDIYTTETLDNRLTLYVRASDILAMTGPMDNDRVQIRYLYLSGLNEPFNLFDTEDNYNKVIKALENS